jgi:FAD/FMN-containing dehydrogenase
MFDIPALTRDLRDIPLIADPARVRQKSRDFYWYSPLLKEALDGVSADLVAVARDETDVIAVLRACYAREVPVTVRAGGTGNYGQAMPLKGGVVLDVSALNRVKWIRPGAVRAEAGITLLALDAACQADSRQELRFHPSTRSTASVGGFVAGGSSGIGSVTWGLLRDRGNILGLRVITMEAEPRVIELRGNAVEKANHAYGTNGVITEVEMPLAAAFDWIEAVVACDDLGAACAFAQAFASHDGITKKLASVVTAPLAHQAFRPLRPFFAEHQSVVLAMVAAQSWEAFEALAREAGATIGFKRAAVTASENGVPPLYEFTWNHTTLHAMKFDRKLTYLQSLFAAPHHLERVAHMVERFGDEVPMHLEFVRMGGEPACFGIQLVRYTTPARLAEIIDYHNEHGCPIFNPHVYTLEEGGMKQVDRVQLAFKREADPKGLLNPGKMIAWERPDYDGSGRSFHLYQSAA